MISAKFSGNFISSMEERQSKWAASKLRAVIKVPPELSWWYYQEYGVKPRPGFRPAEANTFAFPGAEGVAYPESVDWPGIQGTHTVGTVFNTIPSLAKELLPEIFFSGNYDPTQINELFMTEFMPRIKAEIVELMAQTLPGTRPADPQHPKQGGRLGGRTASSVFEENATIEPLE